MLSVSLFGHLRLNVDGKDVRFAARPKVTPLLAYLVLHREQSLPRDAIAFALWPDEPEIAARRNLRRHLGYLREALPRSSTPWLLVDGESARWNPATPVSVDVIDFEHRVHKPETRRQAVDLYTADLLLDCYDEWVIALREKLRSAYLSALWALMVEARGRRDVAAASEHLQRILRDDPWREDAVRALMAVRYEAGDRAAALSVCAQFEERLRDEMRVSLMPETAALRHAIEADQPLPTVPLRRAAETVKVAPPDLTFAGRDAEMSRLAELWEEAVDGRGSVVLITGEAGIGKSRLAAQFALFVESRGGRVLWGATSAPEAAPYQAVAETLRAAAGFVEQLRLPQYDRALLARLIPEVGEVPEAAADAEASRLFDIVADIFCRLAAQRPLLLVLEDLQSAGSASVTMVEHLVRRARSSPLLLVATAREAEVTTHDTLGRLRRPRHADKAHVVALGRLPEHAVRDIIAATSLPRDDDEGLIRLATTSRGHPLFLSELIQTAVESRGVDAGAKLPVRLQDAIEERIARLSPNARFLLDAASVVGASFDLDVVGEVVGWSEAELVAAADELVERRALRETGSRSAFDFQFTHDLIAAAAYEKLAPRERRRWHRRAARVATRCYASRLDELAAFIARHFDLGGEAESAAAYYLRAARADNAMFANEEALSHTRRGLKLEPASAALRFDLLVTQEEVHERLGDRAAQRADLGELERVVVHLTDDLDRRCELLRRRESLHRYFVETEQALQVVAELRRIAEGNTRWEAIALREEATLQTSAGSYAEAYETIERASERFEAAGDESGFVFASTYQAHLAAVLGKRDEAAACIIRAKEIAGRLGTATLLMRVIYCEATILCITHAWTNAAAAASTLLELAEKIGDHEGTASAHAMLGAVFVSLFKVDDARQHLGKAIELYRDKDLERIFAAYSNLANLELEVGRLDEAERVVGAILQLLERADSRSGLTYVALIRCELALRRAQYGATVELSERVVELARQRADRLFESEGLRCKGIALREAGAARDAVVALATAREGLIAIHASDYARRATAELSLACSLAGDPAAEAYAAEALAPPDGGPTGAPQTATLWTLAQTLQLLGQTERAQELLRRADNEFAAQMAELSSDVDRGAFVALSGNAAFLRARSGGGWPDPPFSREAPRARKGVVA